MLDVMQTIKEEVLDDRMLQCCKDLVESGTQTTVVFVCNSRDAIRHLLTIPTHMIIGCGWNRLIRNLAYRTEADAIVTIDPGSLIAGQLCMAITVETLLNRYGMVYPYEWVGHQVVWEEPRQLPLPDRYGDLLPAPAGMAQA